jgi:hypothetical protein
MTKLRVAIPGFPDTESPGLGFLLYHYLNDGAWVSPVAKAFEPGFDITINICYNDFTPVAKEI